MSTNEELEEHAHHAKEPFDRKVAVTMAIIAAALATVSVGAHIFANEELLLQQQASDQWAYYQAKSARRYASDIARDTLKLMQSAEVSEKYSKNAERYEKEGEEIQVEARKLEEESKLRGKQSLRMEIGEVFLEIGIVFASLAILSKRQLVWVVSMVSAGVGLLIAITAAFPDFLTKVAH
jgi:hypothetical protein